MKTKILITGASGFVGQNLTANLQGSGLDVVPLKRVQLEELEDAMLHNVDTIVHLAGKAHDLKNVSSSDDYYAVNFELTRKLYDAFLQSNAKNFVFISSVKAAADVVDGVLTEDIIPDPKTHYGKSKLMAEAYIISQELPVNKSFYILRPCMIHGPKNKGNLNLLYQFIKRRIPYPLAAFQNKRSFLSIENLCFVIKELICQKDVPSGVYNIADDESLSTTEVVGILAQAIGKRPLLWRISKPLIIIAAKIGDTLKLPLNTERLNKLTEDYVVSNSKIIKALNVKLPVSARVGLLATSNSFKS